jgi:hypothetical protein
MSRHILGLTALLLLASVMPVRACINDREVNRTEREFKSQYLQPPPATNPSPTPSQEPVMPVAFLGGGAVLLIGATLMVLNPRQRSSRA